MIVSIRFMIPPPEPGLWPQSSDMYGLPLDRGPWLCSQCLVRDRIDRAACEVFNVELHVEVALRRRRAVEPHEDVDVAVIDILIARE